MRLNCACGSGAKSLMAFQLSSILLRILSWKDLMKFEFPIGVPRSLVPEVISGSLESFPCFSLVLTRFKMAWCSEGRHSYGEVPFVDVRIKDLSSCKWHPRWGPWVVM